MFNTIVSVRNPLPEPTIPVTDQLVGYWIAGQGRTGSPNLTTWADQSGNGNDWLEDTGSGGQGPTVVTAALGGYDVLNFDGANDKMSQSGFLSGSTQDGSMAVLVRRTTTANKGWHVFGSSSTQPHFMHGNLIYETFGCASRPAGLASSAFDLNEWGVYLVTVGDGGGFLKRYANDVEFGNQSVSRNWHATFRLGTGDTGGAVGGTDSFQGQIAEMAVWDKVLSSGERTDVFDYFNDKYALGL